MATHVKKYSQNDKLRALNATKKKGEKEAWATSQADHDQSIADGIGVSSN